MMKFTYYFVSLLLTTTATLSSSSYHSVEAFSSPLHSYHHIKIINNKISVRSITTTKIRHQQRRITTKISLSNDDDDDDDDDDINNDNDNNYNNNNAVWSPNLRRIIGGIASLGAIETGYLTYAKLFGGSNGGGLLFCDESSSGGYSSCDQVLNGPYSNLPFFDHVPLASLGLVAYTLVGVLALKPIIFENDNGNDNTNRILLTTLTTTMGTFSIFLMTLLFGVLKTECPYCIFSAGCSILLANLALIGGCLPEQEVDETSEKTTTGSRTVATGFLSAIIGAVLLFGTGSMNTFNSASNSFDSGTLLASINGSNRNNNDDGVGGMKIYSPPEITTESSKRALDLARTLNTMDAKMYGAYWCSHCFDQKEAFGKQVFSHNNENPSKFNIEYVECSKDGENSQTKLCKSKEVPGYPTWEIQGKLYPGEQELDELEDLVKTIMAE